MVNFTLEDLARTLREVAAERPGFVYRREPFAYRRKPGEPVCQYAHADGGEGCIFGVALARLGVDAASLANVCIDRILATWFGGDSVSPRYRPFLEVQNLQLPEDRRPS